MTRHPATLLIAVLAATALSATALAASSTPPKAAASSANPSDLRLARKLVAAKGDVPSGMFSTNWGLRPGRCLPRIGFTITARSTGPTWGGVPSSWVNSVATVLKTNGQAKAHYRATVGAMSACLAGQLRGGGKSAPSIGSARTLTFPRYGDQSAARRMKLDFKGNGAGEFHKYTLDWVAVRKRRTVLVDDFQFWVGWRNGPLTVVGAERRTVNRELTRAFGN
jgi:hypothetical protein